MTILRQIVHLCVVILFSVFGANMAFAVPLMASDISYYQTETTQVAQADDVGFSARASPMVAANVVFTGGSVVDNNGNLPVVGGVQIKVIVEPAGAGIITSHAQY